MNFKNWGKKLVNNWCNLERKFDLNKMVISIIECCWGIS